MHAADKGPPTLDSPGLGVVDRGGDTGTSDRLEPCAVAFVDDGLSRGDVGLAAPFIVGACIFRWKERERATRVRETFDHVPQMLGQLTGGFKADPR